MNKEKVKEINLKIEKIGVVHYFAIICQEDIDLEPKVCEDCGETVTRHSIVLCAKRNLKTNKPISKTVCNNCLELYKTKDLDMPVTTKLGDYYNKPLGRIFKFHKPHLSKCMNCNKEFDLYKFPMYIYKGESYCPACLYGKYDIDYIKCLPPLFLPVENRKDEDIFEELYAKLDVSDHYGQMLLRKLETIVVPTNSYDAAYRDCYSERVDALENKYFKTYPNIIACLNELELNDIYKGSQSRNEDGNYTLTCKKVPTETLVNQFWCDEEAGVRITEEGEITILHDTPHGPRYAPTLFFIKKVEDTGSLLHKDKCEAACSRCGDDTPVCAC